MHVRPVPGGIAPDFPVFRPHHFRQPNAPGSAAIVKSVRGVRLGASLRSRVLPAGSTARALGFFYLLVLLASLLACAREEMPAEIAYVSVPQTFLRDRVAPVYQKVATVHSGDRVEILDRRRRFALVRLPNGEQGWLQERYLVSQQVFEVANKLPETTRSFPSQARAVTRATVNLHILPGRDTPHLYQLKADQPIEVLKRVARVRDQAPPAPAPQKEKEDDGRDEVAEPPALPMEDWWLVRTPDGSRAGWILGRMMFVDLPLDVAQYSEGARIVAFFVLNEVQDGDKSYPQYLVLYTDPKDGLPYDFNQVRVFSWNTKRHRYETAFRERNLEGFLPVTVAKQDFGKEGILPVFVLSAENKEGIVMDRKYRLIGPVVRRIELPPQSTHAGSASRELSAQR
jgi:hypothetical protein